MSRFAKVGLPQRPVQCHTCKFQEHLKDSNPKEAKDFEELLSGPISKELVRVMNEIAKEDGIDLTFSNEGVRRHRERHMGASE